MKTGRFVDKEASAPVDHAATPVAFSGWKVQISEKHRCFPVTLASRAGDIRLAALQSRGRLR